MKNFKRILALALAGVMSMSTAAVVAAEDVVVPEPIKVYTMDSAEDYEVLVEGSKEVAIVTDLNEETGKGKGNVLAVPASNATGADTEIRLVNPFSGYDLTEGTQTAAVRGDDYEADDIGMPIWYDGVVINYWIKTTSYENSIVLNFRNEDRMQYHKDDWIKHLLAIEAKEAYDAAKEAGTAIDSRFALGEVAVYVDENGKEYNVYSGGGEFMNYNPDYENGFVLGNSGTPISVYKKGTPAEDLLIEDTWVLITSAGKDEFDAYYDIDFNTNPKSLVRQSETDGFLRFSLNGTIIFSEDDGSGMNINPYVATDDPTQFNVHNTLRLKGSDYVIDTLAEPYEDSNDWHMVTIVIQNDWITYYFDGEEYDEMTEDFTYFDTTLNSNAAGKSFNAGFGLRAPYQRGAAARVDVLSGNRVGLLLTEYLSHENTTLSIGGSLTGPIFVEKDLSAFPERVTDFYIDDIAFYGELLDEEQINALYEAGLEEIMNPVTTLSGDASGDGKVDANDALAVLKHAAKLAELEGAGLAAAQTNGDDKIDANDALNILKYAAKLINELPVK